LPDHAAPTDETHLWHKNSFEIELKEKIPIFKVQRFKITLKEKNVKQQAM